jgi:predicted RND superfamily exporter protein
MNSAFFESSQKDMSTLIPLMFLVVILTVFLLTRSVSSTFSTLVIMILSIVTAMGAAGHLGIKLTPPSSVAPTIILTLAVADSIHIIVSMLMEMRKGKSKKDALVESIRLNFNPVLLTSLSTVIGFLAMNFGEVPPFWDLGNMTAIGMVAAFLYSLTILPALLMILPVKVKIRDEKSIKDSWYERLGKYVSYHPKRMALYSGVIVLIFGFIAKKNIFNDEFVKYFDKTVDFRNDTDYISENLTGVYNVEFSVPASESGGINEPDYLNKLNEFEEWLNIQPEVVHVNSYVEVSKRINKSMHGDNLAYYDIPQSREESAQYLLLYEMSLPFGLDLNNQINVDKSETRVTVTTENLRSPDLIAFSKRSENWLQENAPVHMHALGTSPTLMFSNLGFRQATSMLNGNILAVILITILLIISLRSLKLGLLSLIPNLTPVIVGFGIWAMVSGQINTGMVIVFGMTLGIVVDDTIHFMSKYIRARREHNLSAVEAVQYAFSTVGKALVTTTIVLIAGFAILSQSSFGLNNGMARISTIIILAALIIDFILLPAILILTSRKQTALTTKNIKS